MNIPLGHRRHNAVVSCGPLFLRGPQLYHRPTLKQLLSRLGGMRVRGTAVKSGPERFLRPDDPCAARREVFSRLLAGDAGFCGIRRKAVDNVFLPFYTESI